MKTIGKIFILFFVIATFACSSQQDKSDVLSEANRVHLLASEIHHRLENQLDSAKTATHDSFRIKMLDSLSNLVELWEESMIEVPGFEHEHDHSGEHHHHKPAPSMTDESMLEYQQNAHTAIRELEKSFNDLKL
ncbi:hypothetical protein DSL64_13170 [Dyadobacter luteus]|uniref:Uncharacterized protein n=1 Tax=Dyadobacter luteus TaxID=2259619 RepID=A0A3D8YAM5_9BACT|nr:hypothetical protein [Dyadobacter luteus]REA60853.1 hypothetical protein DSL64_13170 [Dyadobacter luteus]